MDNPFPIKELSEIPELLEDTIQYVWSCFGDKTNTKFYRDVMINATNANAPIPKFYFVVDEGKIAASYALLRNDIISRQDLEPWFACLYVNTDYRHHGLAEVLVVHGLAEAKRKGYDKLYVSTKLENFYEELGWKHIGIGYGISDKENKIYEKATA